MAKLFKTDGSVVEIKPASGKRFSISEAQRYVGGYVGIVHLDNGERLLVNEDGYMIGLPRNEKATGVLGSIGSKEMADPVVGDAILCSRVESLA